MEYVAISLVALVALEHVYILILEMFLWTRPRTQKIFGIKKGEGEVTKILAANQGLYNGFLSAGLIWGLVHPNAVMGHQIQLFFVSCVLVAAVYGSLTVKKSILLVQGLPALLALSSLLFL
jgi:putative membrane protein